MHAINRTSEAAFWPLPIGNTCYYRAGKNKKRRLPLSQAEPPISANLTMELLQKAGGGDRSAMNALFERLAPPLHRFARGRLPGWARGMIDTTDLVQDALISTFRIVERGDMQDDGAVHAYVRQILRNRIIDELRKVNRRPALGEMERSFEGDMASPLEDAIGEDALNRYEAALKKMKPADRDAVLARIELGLSFKEIAAMLGRPSADAARMSVSRALVVLAEAMADEVGS
jgi:RNA polymerase sigma-70 factor (ECF subfamily)